MKKLAAVFLLAMLSSSAFAITDVRGKVARIYINEPNVYFSLKNDQCGNNIGTYYYFKLDTEAKRAWYTLILAAASTDKVIDVSLPLCPVGGAPVEVRYIFQDF